MCDERERLIEYLFDESPPNDRRRVEAHLASCETCRVEMGGFRAVRQDLLAWDVPDPPALWAPFAPARRPTPLWRQMPAWALATAACAIFAVGAAGGLVGPVLATAAEPPSVRRAAVDPPRAPVVRLADVEGVEAFESRLLALTREEMVRTRAAVPPPAPERVVVRSEVNRDEILRDFDGLLRESEGRTHQQTRDLVREFLTRFLSEENIRRQSDAESINYLNSEVQALRSAVQTLLDERQQRIQ